MANKNALNKNSVYVQSLVDFVLDTKPYHSKLTEIVEEYRFFDEVKVTIEERMSSKLKIGPTTMYNYFSSATPLYRTMPAKRLVSPSFSVEVFKAGLEENRGLRFVPFAYSQKTYDGSGVNAVYVRRREFTEPLVESIDFFQNRGSFQFSIKQTKNANGDFNPLWVSGADDGVIGEAIRTTQRLALDKTDPKSAWNQIHAILDEVQAAVTSIGGHPDVQRELFNLYETLNSGTLPRSYEALLAWLGVPRDDGVEVPLSEPHDREWMQTEFERLSSPLFFNTFTDLGESEKDVGFRESGLTHYQNTSTPYLSVENIVLNLDADVQEWTLHTVTPGDTLYQIIGSVAGMSGFVRAGGSFDNGRISFKTRLLGTPPRNDTLTLTPTRKLLIGTSAKLETWNIIKTNPIAFSRPKFSSPSYGDLGAVTILDQSIPSGDIVLTSRGDGFFELTSTSDPTYTGLAEAGRTFNDGRLIFTITKGTRSFVKGERFYITIENLPAQAKNLDLGYGYDLDPYDDDMSLYPSGETIGFYFDGRFTDYDLSRMNLQVNESAKDGRKWRVRAIPNFDRQIVTLDTLNPDAPLRIYYADHFVVEYSDDDFLHTTFVDNVAINGSFSSDVHGISFTLPAASRPFIAAAADDGTEPQVLGGDTFSFDVSNPLPRVVETSVSAARYPRLNMHSHGFYDAPEAQWTIEFTSADAYLISAVGNGSTLVPPTACTLSTPGVLPYEGNSFQDKGIHYTIVTGDGVSAGDKFTFQTFGVKPSYLVHGSVTGFTQPATVGEFYWNGQIGFKLNLPQAQTYIDGKPVELPVITTVREDCPSVTYNFTRTPAGFMVSRSDTGATGFVALDGLFIDEYLQAQLDGSVTHDFSVFVDAHDFQLWNTAGLVILNPSAVGRLPNFGESVVVETTEDGQLGLNIVPSTVDLSPLAPITIDQRFIDLNTRGVPLSNTSPETALLQGWIPTTVKKMDSATSIAEFSDPATSYIFTSSASNEAIGILKQQTTNPNEPIVFEWDENFYSKYLPLNAEANLIITGTGWDDKVHARMTESIKFLIDGGALLEDQLFHDDIHVKIVDTNFISTVSNLFGEFNATVKDGPFAGFLPGYGNLPYDAEFPDGTSLYDAGLPLDIQSLLAKSYPDTEEGRLQKELDKQEVLDRWGNFIATHEVPLTKAQIGFMRDALFHDTTGELVADDFGNPLVGMGMDIVDRPANALGARFLETMAMQAVDTANTLESKRYDQGLLDSLDDITAIISYSGPIPPDPVTIPADATYETFDTPITVTTPTRVFQVSFNGTPDELASLRPTFRFWAAGEAAAFQVGVVERVNPRLFRFMMAKPTPGKIIVG